MRTYRSSRGPFSERPYFSESDIENLCTEELRKVSLLPAEPQPIRIERFIEKRFGITPLYEDLPNGILGFTRFTAKGVDSISVSRALAEEGEKVSERRINSTLAHEAGHGLLHVHLFAVGSQPERLFGDDFDPEVPTILCRDDKTGRPAYDGRWWEFQANQTIGALLLPKALAHQALVSKLLVSAGTFGLPRLNEKDRARAVELLADTFNVNPAVAKIRLEQLFPANESTQLTL